MNYQTPPGRAPQRPDPDEYTAERRAEAERRAAEHAREVRKARIELALIGAAIIAGIVIIAVIIGAIARSGQDGDQPQTPVTNSAAVTDSASDPPESETEPDIGITGKTRTLKDEIDSDYAIMIDLSSHEVLMTKKGEERIYPASMTKIMTLIVAYEHMTSLDGTFEMTEDILGPLWLENATVAGFLPGEKVSVEDLMYGLILPSGADCAVALSRMVAGSEEAFAVMMNEKVAELGLEGTHFMNPTGLHDPKQYSTCHDIARILEYAIGDEFMRTVLSTYRRVCPKTEQHPEGLELTSTMQQKMRGDEAPGMYICGGKTGYTDEARCCLASFAVRSYKDSLTDSEIEEMRLRTPEYIFVSAHGLTKWTPVFDAINAYALVIDENALETRQYSQG